MAESPTVSELRFYFDTVFAVSIVQSVGEEGGDE
jgi:hypothetical protein